MYMYMFMCVCVCVCVLSLRFLKSKLAGRLKVVCLE